MCGVLVMRRAPSRSLGYVDPTVGALARRLRDAAKKRERVGKRGKGGGGGEEREAGGGRENCREREREGERRRGGEKEEKEKNRKRTEKERRERAEEEEKRRREGESRSTEIDGPRRLETGLPSITVLVNKTFHENKMEAVPRPLRGTPRFVGLAPGLRPQARVSRIFLKFRGGNRNQNFLPKGRSIWIWR